MPFKGECAAEPVDEQKGETRIPPASESKNKRNMDEVSHYCRYVKNDITV
jgi:hypothetical protein